MSKTCWYCKIDFEKNPHARLRFLKDICYYCFNYQGPKDEPLPSEKKEIEPNNIRFFKLVKKE